MKILAAQEKEKMLIFLGGLHGGASTWSDEQVEVIHPTFSFEFNYITENRHIRAARL